MKKVPFLLGALICLLTSPCFGQQPFNNCTAAFLNSKMVVDDYSPTGKCIVAKNAIGILTVCTANLSPTESLPVDKIKFKIARRDKNTGTLTMFSNKTFRQIDIRAVLSKCQAGDHIVLITMNDAYAMPHNEILIQ